MAEVAAAATPVVAAATLVAAAADDTMTAAAVAAATRVVAGALFSCSSFLFLLDEFADVLLLLALQWIRRSWRRRRR